MALYPAAIVVDCSAIIEMMFPEKSNPYCLSLEKTLRESRVLAPKLFFYETANVLLKQLRRGKSTLAEMLLQLNHMENLVQEAVDIKDMSSVNLLAHSHHLTAYDASYLAIAKSYNVPLATLDTALKKAALAENLFYNPAP